MNRSTVTVRRLDGGDEPLKGSAVTLFEDVSALSTRHGRPVPAPVMEREGARGAPAGGRHKV